ncbi:putative MFS family arabinose efflux permease [Paraburkholderia sp. BL18I3N2]|uniref:YbfB/YjiJ family MFS transporter n=1 Tax=Paraburkholderia sp. BL18I3N2 TaxID=1938799 RepID=UPI000D05B5DF|nr:YbfB/YjiJ family MFS transporter [Paraburkholderia sp. BL18I3N2]PRX36175.1 putative MFS family arabinose efflux permease [Paraburkholderia sp. BL18I3N2]
MSAAPITSDSSVSLDARALFATLAGLCGSLVAIGLARFAYTPLIPSLIQAHWFTSSQAVTLGAANFAGYLVGALIGRPLASALSNRSALRMLMAVVTAAFFACAYPLSVSWFFAWRLLSGISGGAIMVLVATSILPHIPVPRRGFVSGMIFLGLGLGIAASGTLIPQLLHYGLQTTWIGLGVVALVLTAVSWFGWPSTNPPAPVAPSGTHHAVRPHGLTLRVLYAQYAANALGLVPAMVLLVDYIARGLGRGAAIGADYWVLYGLAAIAGPVICGNVADRIGFGKAYRVGLLLQAAAVAMLAFSGSTLVLVASTVILGIFTPGIVPLTLGRIHELVPHDHIEQRAAWSRATTAFALFQALGGYGYSYLFSHTHNDYALIFACGAAALTLAYIGDLIASRIGTARHTAA